MTSATEHGTITEAGLAAMRSRIGIPNEARRYGARRGLFTLINQDSAHIYATGSGDANPLYQDAAYARASHWGSVVAPPTILFNAGLVEGRPLTAREREEGRGGGLPGVHGMFSGADWEWYQPLREGDEIHRVNYLSDAQEKSGVFAGRQVLALTESLFRNQHGEVLAKEVEWSMRTERDGARERNKYDWEQHEYTNEELERIDEAYANERPRGAEPRYWEDVQVGDALDGIVRGPYRATDAVAWDIGWGGVFARSGKVDYDYRQRHPRAYSKNRYGIPDIPERVHWESEFAREVGVPGLYDYGPQRIAWASTLVTNWMGDSGFLKRLWGAGAPLQRRGRRAVVPRRGDREADRGRRAAGDLRHLGGEPARRGDGARPGDRAAALTRARRGAHPRARSADLPKLGRGIEGHAGGPGPAPPPLDHARLPAARRAALTRRSNTRCARLGPARPLDGLWSHRRYSPPERVHQRQAVAQGLRA